MFKLYENVARGVYALYLSRMFVKSELLWKLLEILNLRILNYANRVLTWVTWVRSFMGYACESKCFTWVKIYAEYF